MQMQSTYWLKKVLKMICLYVNAENWHRWVASHVWQYAAACTKVHWCRRRLQPNNNFQKVHTAYTTATHNHSQHNQASSHEVLTSLVLVLLTMGIMMPETCWDWFNLRNIHLVIVASVGSVIHLSCLGCWLTSYIFRYQTVAGCFLFN
jgi:hypothetical protein